jgi:hypothetical protein
MFVSCVSGSGYKSSRISPSMIEGGASLNRSKLGFRVVIEYFFHNFNFIFGFLGKEMQWYKTGQTGWF